MLRFKPGGGIAILGLAALIAASAIRAVAQGGPAADRELGLRLSVVPDDLLRDRARRERPRRQSERPVGQIPSYGTPPGSGAAGSGFVSTNVPRPRDARRARARARTGAAGGNAPAPLDLAPPAVAPARERVAMAQATPQAMVTQTVRASGASGPVRDLATAPARPVIEARRRLAEEDPFAPLGFHTGAFVIRPAIEASGGYDSNPARSPGGRASWFGVVGSDLQVRSDWQRHEFRADVRGTYTAYEATSSLDRPYLEARANGRIDVTGRTKAEFEGRFLLSTDNPGSPDLPADLAKLPIFTQAGVTAGVAQAFNRFEIALKTAFDRFDYRKSKLTDGSLVSNRDRDYDRHGIQARAGYELTPSVKPFVEVDADTRKRESAFDRFGFRRSSDGLVVKAGGVFDLTRSLTGEIAAGYLTRRYDDPRLGDLRGIVTDASLIWTATALTTVTLKAATAADESTLPGVSGVLRRDASVQVDHAFRRWLIGTLKFAYGNDDYEGSPRDDDRYAASAALTYKFSRFASLKGEFRQEWLRSNVPGNDYAASIGVIGLRLQP